MTRILLTAALALALAPLAGCAGAPSGANARPAPTLRAFESDAELLAFQARLAREMERRSKENPPPPPLPPPAPPAPGAAAAPADPAAESVTNVQHAGVDEGGIVKVHGEHLVILRRGRLFTVKVGGGALEPVAAVDAFAPGIEPSGDWYDEMLISGDQVVVIGYSYERGGTEVGLFRIDPAGGLTHRATYNLRSGDYYSSRNYASRLIGSRLIFYSPLPVRGGDLRESLPAFRRWDSADSAFTRIAPPSRVYRPAGPVRMESGLVLHSVTTCDLASPDVECQATALYGPPGRVFYVSPSAVYVWASTYPLWYEDWERVPVRSVVYRMPLDGTAPTGLRATGGPLDQLSFLESGDGHLNVLLRSDGRGEGMFAAEWGAGEMALLRVPLSSFGDGSGAAPPERYRRLPKPANGSMQNRYVGDWLLYGAAGQWRGSEVSEPPLYAVRWAGDDPADTLMLPHWVERIEAMGSGAVAVGSRERDLLFSGVRLGARAEPAGRYTRSNAAQGESRTHGFFYRADGPESGLLGLPIRGGGDPRFAHLMRGSASVLFLRNDAFRLSELGALDASQGTDADDGCRASCVDWYGNARPLFLRGRVFALMGYELVEGAVDDGRIREVRRVSFAPNAATAEAR